MREIFVALEKGSPLQIKSLIEINFCQSFPCFVKLPQLSMTIGCEYESILLQSSETFNGL